MNADDASLGDALAPHVAGDSCAKLIGKEEASRLKAADPVCAFA